jgi:type I restriction enzyme S subunit
METEFEKCPLGEVAAVRSGYAFKSSAWVKTGVPVIKIANVKDGRLILDGCPFVTPEVAAEADEFRLQVGDLLIAMTGYIGEVALVRDDRHMMLNQRVGRFSVQRPDRLDIKYLYYCLRHPEVRREIENLGYGSAQPNVSPTLIHGVEIPLSPLSDQRAIAHILGTLDDKIELNRQMNETLEGIARAIFKSWFVDFDPVHAESEGRDPGLPRHLADLFPESFEESELGELPKGWRTGQLSDVAENPRRGVQPDEIVPSTPYIALEHMPRRSIALSEWGHAVALESNKFEFKRGEILFGKLRPYFHKVGVAPLDGVCSTDILVVASKQPEWFGFVLGHLSSAEFVEHTNAGSTGTKMPRTNWQDMARYELALPPPALAAAFNARIQMPIDRIIKNIHESRTLAALRDALLPRLISGELRVKDAERIIGQRA